MGTGNNTGYLGSMSTAKVGIVGIRIDAIGQIGVGEVNTFRFHYGHLNTTSRYPRTPDRCRPICLGSRIERWLIHLAEIDSRDIVSL